MEPLRFGILGTASIVPRFLGGLRESGCGIVAAVASRDGNRAKEKAAEWGLDKSYGSYEELLADGGIDAVYVPVVNSAHYRCALTALEHGKHVICEKPFTLRKAEAQKLFETARKNRLFLAEAQKAVFLPVMEEIKRLLGSGSLGKAHVADFTSSYPQVYGNWFYSKEAGGGCLYGNAGYSVALSQYLFGEAEAYSGLLVRGDSGVDERCAVNLRLAGGVMAVSKVAVHVQAVNRMLIFCDRGYVEVPDYWKARRAVIHFSSGVEQTLDYPCEYEMAYELRHFCRCIRGGLLQSPVMDERMTVKTAEILENLSLG